MTPLSRDRLIEASPNVVRFAYYRQKPEALPPSNPWTTPQAIERAVAKVAAMPAAHLLNEAEVSVMLAAIKPTTNAATACAFTAMLCLCRYLDDAGFRVPAMGAQS